MVQVTLKAGIGIPVTDGIADVVKGHPALTGRKDAKLCDISVLVQDPGKAQDEEFAQVVAVLTVTERAAKGSKDEGGAAAAKGSQLPEAGLHLLLVRWYGNPEDERRSPLTMRAVMWHELLEAAKLKEAAAAKGSKALLQGQCKAAGQGKRVHFSAPFYEVVHVVEDELAALKREMMQLLADMCKGQLGEGQRLQQRSLQQVASLNQLYHAL
jgi:hypothetical protein